MQSSTWRNAWKNFFVAEDKPTKAFSFCYVNTTVPVIVEEGGGESERERERERECWDSRTIYSLAPLFLSCTPEYHSGIFFNKDILMLHQ